MHAIDFIQDLAVIMLIAGFVTILCHRFKQPVVLGYIIAGVIIGPHTPPFALVHDEQTIKTLAELGVIFLMFCLGLEFSLRKLFQVGATAFLAAFLEITLMIWAGFEIGRLFDWNTMDSLFLGAILAMSSTTIIIKVLGDLKLKNERFAQLIFGVLIIEDILGIGIIALFSGIAVSGTVEADQVVSTVGKLSLFMVVALVVGILLVPRLLAYVAKFESNEMLLVTVLGLCFGFCLLVIKLEYSVVLGAFLIGAIMAESRQLLQIERLMWVAKETGLEAELKRGLARTAIASVGPVVQAALEKYGLAADIQPENCFHMKPLARAIARWNEAASLVLDDQGAHPW